MVGVLLHETVLEAAVGEVAMIGAQTAIGCDNSATVSWTTRMATRSASPISYRLLRGLAMRERQTRSAPPALFHVPGSQNTLADVASRHLSGVVPHYHLLDTPSAMCTTTCLTLFNYSYPNHKVGCGFISFDEMEKLVDNLSLLTREKLWSYCFRKAREKTCCGIWDTRRRVYSH